ncbi:MAG: hypothetical protein U0931_41200 [Vulcanimicrobiota bacterium]
MHSDDRVDISPERVKGKAHRHGGWRSALFCALASLPLVGLAAACGKAEPNPAPAPVVTESTTVVTTLAPPEQTTVVVSTTVPSTVAVTTTTLPAPPVTESTTTTTAAPEPPPEPTPEAASTSWDWHEHFSAYELAPHQLYSNDCGVTAVRAELRAHGLDATQDEIFDDAIAGHFHAGRAKGNGWNGPYKMVDYLQSLGLDARMEAFNQTNVRDLLDQGKPFIVSTERHYFVISGEEDGRLVAGATGEVVGLGSSLTYNQLSGFGGAHRIIVVDSTEALAPSRAPLTALS